MNKLVLVISMMLFLLPAVVSAQSQNQEVVLAPKGYGIVPEYTELHKKMMRSILDMRCPNFIGVDQENIDAEFQVAFRLIKSRKVSWFGYMSEQVDRKSGGAIKMQLFKTDPASVKMTALKADKKITIELRNESPFFYRCVEE